MGRFRHELLGSVDIQDEFFMEEEFSMPVKAPMTSFPMMSFGSSMMTSTGEL